VEHHNLLLGFEGNLSNKTEILCLIDVHKEGFIWLCLKTHAYQNHTAMTLPSGSLMQLAEVQMKEPKQTCHLRISMKVRTQLNLDFLSLGCEIHLQVPEK